MDMKKKARRTQKKTEGDRVRSDDFNTRRASSKLTHPGNGAITDISNKAMKLQKQI